MIYHFILNPKSGRSRRHKNLDQVIKEACKKRHLDYHIYYTTCPGDATEYVRSMVRISEERQRFICVGGDGSINEIVNSAPCNPNVEFGVIPQGSGNDFVRNFSNHRKFHDIDAQVDGGTVSLDLIKCNDSYALNICSVGLDARIGTDVSNYKRLPLLHGFRAYAASTVVNLFKGISEHYVVELNGETVDGEHTFVCVCNGRFYGGGFNPVPEADPTDGKLDVLLVKKVNLLQVPGIIGKYKNGRYKELPQLVKHYLTDRVVIRCDKPTPINLDGELRTAQVVEMSVAKEKLRFFYPRGLTWQAEVPVSVK